MKRAGIIVALALITGSAQAGEMPILKSYRVPSVAMLPTLHPGDVFMADAVAYKTEPPKRGDIVVFRGPRDIAYVKRVIAIGGDQISSEAGVLTLNGETAVLARLPMTLENPPRNAQIWAEGISGGSTAQILNVRDNAPGDDFPERTVPDGHIFVLGDNRDNSSDSRFQIGMVSFDRLMGKALTIVFSPNLRRIGLPVE